MLLRRPFPTARVLAAAIAPALFLATTHPLDELRSPGQGAVGDIDDDVDLVDGLKCSSGKRST